MLKLENRLKLVAALKNSLPDDEMHSLFVCNNSIEVAVPGEDEVIEFIKKRDCKKFCVK